MRTVIIIQARTGSSRLPGKVLLPLAGESLLIRMIDRVAASTTADAVVIATTREADDDAIELLCNEHGYACYRGHSTDLLDRHYQTAKAYGADVVVKIPSDCPLIDPAVIDRVIGFYQSNAASYDFVSNLHPATYPDGNDVEVMPLGVLKEAWLEASKEYEREHTTPFIWEQPERYRIGNVEWEGGRDYSMTRRFTIDYPEDYEFVRRVYDELYTPEHPIFSLGDILALLEMKPEIFEINKQYAGVNWYRLHLAGLGAMTRAETRFAKSDIHTPQP